MNNTTASPLVMTFDFGTQSVRVSIIGKDGTLHVCEKQRYEPAYVSPKPGWAEQDPEYYFQCLCSCTKRIGQEHKDLLNQVGAITLTCFRDSAVLLDKDNKVVRPMVLWLDQRYAKCKDKLPFFSRLLFKLVGKSATIELNRRRTIANWVKENEPENWARTAKYISVSTYFIYRLTGKMADCASDFTGHYPIDYRHKRFYKKPHKHLQGQIFSLTEDKLCDIVPEGSFIGEITEETSSYTGLPAGLKMYAAGSDKSCETLGAGVIDKTKASVSLGTAVSIETVTEKYKEPFPFLPAYPSVQPGCFNLDLQVYRGCWMINWFLKEFGAKVIDDIVVSEVDVSEYDVLLPSIPPGSDGVTLQPYWGSQLDKPEVKGAIVGFSDNTTRAHVYKAIIEGIGYEIRYGMERFEKLLKVKFDEIRISGGGSVSDNACQTLADLLGKKLVRVQTNETASLGAAISGFLSIGEFKTPEEAVKAMVRPTFAFEPNMKIHETYNLLYKEVYSKLYPSLKDIYKFLYRYTAR